MDKQARVAIVSRSVRGDFMGFVRPYDFLSTGQQTALFMRGRRVIEKGITKFLTAHKGTTNLP